MTPSPRAGLEAPASGADAVRDQPRTDRVQVADPAPGDGHSAPSAGEALPHRAVEVVAARRRSYGEPRARFAGPHSDEREDRRGR